MCKGNVCKQFFFRLVRGGVFEDPICYNYVVGVSILFVIKK